MTIYDEEIKEYKYEVIEPKLSDEDIKIKDQLIYFFRVRADIDVFDQDENKKMKNLEQALEKIIYENHIKIEDEAKDRIFYYVFKDNF